MEGFELPDDIDCNLAQQGGEGGICCRIGQRLQMEKSPRIPLAKLPRFFAPTDVLEHILQLDVTVDELKVLEEPVVTGAVHPSGQRATSQVLPGNKSRFAMCPARLHRDNTQHIYAQQVCLAHQPKFAHYHRQ